jgi:ADP-ribose pyrophosphatase YjhB (NUDIX family)
MFRYCPSCASQKIEFKRKRLSSCPDCGFLYYHNTATGTGCVISSGETIVLLIRGKKPARGKLDVPGGFVEPGEGLIDGLLRECREELDWEPPEPAFAFLASFPNTYPYKGITYTTCDIFFTIAVPGLSEKDFHLDPGEISGVRFLKPSEINPDDLAFDSTRRAIAAYREMTHAIV